MPRSNKKKSTSSRNKTDSSICKMPWPPPEADMTTTLLLKKETDLMVQRAIASASKHGINLKHGRPNPGLGDCAFEAVIQNNNDRACFKEKYEMSVTWYRQIWATDMANRARNTDYNIFTEQQWDTGWAEMMIPGIYERGLFGDLLLAAIACGIKKFLLIFNTNLNSPHDPIYVVNPNLFNVQPDSEIPIVLAYNMSHYESMEPLSNSDTQETVALVKNYIDGNYKFGKKDIPYLLSLSHSHGDQQRNSEDVRGTSNNFNESKTLPNDDAPTASKRPRSQPTNNTKNTKNKTSEDIRNQINGSKKSNKPHKKEQFATEELDSYPEKQGNFKSSSIKNGKGDTSPTKKTNDHYHEEHIDLEEIDDYLDNQETKSDAEAVSRQGSYIPTKAKIADIRKCNKSNIDYLEDILYFKNKNMQTEEVITQIDGKMQCPICKVMVKNVNIHFQRQKKCGDKIDLTHFQTIFLEFKKRADSRRWKEDANERKCRSRKKKMEKDPIKTREEHAKAEKKRWEKKIQEDPIKTREKHANAEKKRWEKKIQEDPIKTREEHAKAKKEWQQKKMEDNPEYRNKPAEAERIRRQKQHAAVNETTRCKNFNLSTIFGPIFICSCCARKCYENNVTKITDEFRQKVDSKKENFYSYCIRKEEEVEIELNGNWDKTGSYICSTCKTTMLNGKIPSMATVNGLFLPPIEEQHLLTDLENNLIAQLLNFQYIFCLKKSRWAATKKQMISVPVPPETVQQNLQQLPRIPSEAGLIEVGIKRKMEYSRSHIKQLIDQNKIFKVLHYLKACGNPYYQSFDNLIAYEKRCKEQDENGHAMLFSDDNRPDDDEVEGDDDKEDDNEEVIKDTIRKHQFDHNQNTAMTNNYPEMSTDESGRNVNHQLSFAPAEGNRPINLQDEKDWDLKSWPALLPHGKFGLHHKRKVKLTDQQYFCQRILNKDGRFSSSPGYIFAAAAYIEQKQLISKANIAFMRGKKSNNAEGAAQYELDDAFTTFEGIKNTPKYWQKVKYEMLAKLENIGPFHLFFTLSCGDTRYDENFSSFLRERGYKMQYFVDEDGTARTIVGSKDGRTIDKSIEQFLSEDIDESLHEMIRTNVLLATRNFHHRILAFKRDILKGRNNPMMIKHISYRVEFQGRGAAHIHGTLWLDIKEIEKSSMFKERNKGGGSLSEAFRKLRDNVELNNEEKNGIAAITDMFITCSLNPNTVHEDTEKGKRIIDIVRAVNCHHCTNPCEKYGDKCKYGFPKFPLKSTLVIDKNETFIEKDKEQDEKEKKNYVKLLSDVEDILNDDDKIKEIMDKFEKGKTNEEYDRNRSKRIDLLLEMAGNINYDDYIMALKKTRKHGSTVLLKRDVDEVRINNYNPEWALCWNANHDLQPALDFFAVITYITDYWAKPDEGITQYLREAAAMLKSEPDQRKKCIQMANTFLTHRQMGEVEAYYKIIPTLTLKYSDTGTIFIPTDKKELRSKFLQKIDEDDANFKMGTEVVGGRTGKFLEKPDIIDKFCRREILEKDPELEELSPLQFGKMYDPFRRKNIEDEEDGEEENINNETETSETHQPDNSGAGKTSHPWNDEEDRLANYYITTNRDFDGIRLPKTIKIKDPKPGEVTIYVKRSQPKVARFHKKREDNDPHRYFLSELMLYTGYTSEEQLGSNDEKKCRDLYFEKKDAIQYVKSHLMPYTEEIEEARYFVELALKEERTVPKNIGDDLDAEQEREILDCLGDEELHPNFTHVNPDDLEIESNIKQIKKTLKRIERKSPDEILEEARMLDKFQKRALHVAVNFAQDVLIARKGKIPYPAAPLLMVHGGAGSGKSTLIHVMSKYVHEIMLRDGDDLDCPYVMLSAFTGTAAANIDGQTIHTIFSFNFGAGYMSLSDKMRDEKRNLFRNLKMLIIDEISLVDADMLYKIDMRLREITQIGMPFGNVAIFVLGDLMQMRPICGRFIFQEPRNAQFQLSSEMDPLWKKFQCINLEINHRQGEDKSYADVLNRIRIGQETPEDIAKLKKQIRQTNHSDIKQNKDALHIYATNKEVNKVNNKRLKELKGKEHVIHATLLHKTIKNFNPPVGPAGEVHKTAFQKELNLKLHAKVMLIHNVDTSDGLTNGARGELIGIIKDAAGEVSKLVVKFERESVGRERRRFNQDITNTYPGGTPIEKVNFPFSISQSKKSLVNTANVIQFPIKLAFASTTHKIQGATIPKPKKVIIGTSDAFGPAMIYVMLSRICSLDQLLILNEFDESKMFPNMQALEELERLDKTSLNKNPTKWEQTTRDALKIFSLNCRSLNKHFYDIKIDELILKSDFIGLQETWLNDDENRDTLKIPGYNLHLNSYGKGKGLASYYKPCIFKHVLDIKEDNIQLSQFSSPNLNIIVLYRSQQGRQGELNEYLKQMDATKTPQLVIGDFNFCYLAKASSPTKSFLEKERYNQLVREPTHIEGHLLDQAYLQDIEGKLEISIETQSKYFTDHKGIAIMATNKKEKTS